MRINAPLLVSAAVCVILSGPVQAASNPSTAKVQFHLEAQPLVDAVASWSKQSGLQLIWQTRSPEMATRLAPSVTGSYSADEALALLLAGSGLTYTFVDSRTVAILPERLDAAGEVAGEPISFAGSDDQTSMRASNSAASSPGASGALRRSNAENPQLRHEVIVDEIVVTGTNIRGVQPSSPLLVLTREQIKLAGHANIGEVARAIPQNFAGGQNPGVIAAGGVANQDVTGSSSFNLRGIGPDATLTLLNGVRLPYDGFSQATDVSVIPVAAIERLEVLLDGASATYGSDAVGGVANLITKRDYEGLDLSARYGEATEGGYVQNQYDAVAGTTWGGGSVMVTADVSRNSSVKARDRSYLAQLPNQNVTIYPEMSQEGAFLGVRQELGAALEARLDAFYTNRDHTTEVQFSSASRSISSSDSAIWGVVPALQYRLPGGWSLEAAAFLGKNEAEITQRNYSAATGIQASEARTCYCNEAESINVQLTGSLASLPGGEVSMSVGGGYRKNSFDRINLLANSVVTEGSRSSRYGFAEVNVPLVSAAQDVAFIRRLSLNGAVRYEDYGRDDFGDVTTPKVGLIWSPVDSIDAKLSWGKSFKAPTLLQQHQDKTVTNIPASSLGIAGLAPGTTVLVSSGGNSDLEPERAETISAGLVVRPRSLPDLHLEMSYFEIKYSDRVTIPLASFSEILTDPAVADFVSVAPGQAEQAALIGSADLFNDFSGFGYDPSLVGAIVRNTYLNTSEWKLDGVDLYAAYSDLPLLKGKVQVTLGASWIDGTQRLTRQAPEIDVTGVIYFPADFRARAGVSWSRSELTMSAFANHIAGVTNTTHPARERSASMTTVDLVIDYRWRRTMIGDVGINLAVFNALNEEPPHLTASTMFGYSYDSTNYSPLGRNVVLTLSKSF